jgi:hypothetical protein
LDPDHTAPTVLPADLLAAVPIKALGARLQSGDLEWRGLLHDDQFAFVLARLQARRAADSDAADGQRRRQLRPLVRNGTAARTLAFGLRYYA